MPSKKTHNLCIKSGSYYKDGETKNKYKDVGMILKNENGGEMIMIDPSVNFAAFKEQDREFVILSKFEVKETKQTTTAQTTAPEGVSFEE
jgi:hypothetical protein